MKSVDIPLSSSEIQQVRQNLIAWGEKHFRPFPWRLTTDPYRILIAEILLHRTQVKQMKPVYESFISRYPDIHALAQADKEELFQALYSLGLRWRVDLLHEMAQRIEQDFGGQIPRDKQELLTLPGVSGYIAGAVRCFAWNDPEVLMDTNTVRVAGKLLGWEVKDSSRRSKRFRQALSILLNPTEPRSFNYALLDLAHLVCLKRKPPQCQICPLAPWCHFNTSHVKEDSNERTQ